MALGNVFVQPINVVSTVSSMMVPTPGQRWTHKRLLSSGKILRAFLLGNGKLEVHLSEISNTERGWLAEHFVWDSLAQFHEFMKLSSPNADLSRFPHKCPRCASAAYVGAGGGAAVDCTNAQCPTKKR